MKCKALSVIFLLTVLAMFYIAGSLEQEYITDGQAVIALTVNFAAMAVSGYKSGLLAVTNEEDNSK